MNIRIPKHLRDGASMLERYLLNRGKVTLALHVRHMRGIAIADGDADAVHFYKKRYINKLLKITEAPLKICTTHVIDVRGNTEWDDLSTWYLDNVQPDCTYEDDVKKKRAENFLKAASIYHLRNLGFYCDGSWKSDVNGIEAFYFPDGTKLLWYDGLSYIVKLGRLNEFIDGI